MTAFRRFKQTTLTQAKLLITTASLILATSAAAGALEQLEQFLQQSKGASAQFSQTVTTPSNSAQEKARVKKSSGSFSFLRPNLFKFDYQQPFEQLIVSDGKFLWVYDVDLEQVSKQDINQVLTNSAINIIIQAKNLAELQQNFTLTAVNDAKQPATTKIELTPKQTDQQISKILISLTNQQIQQLEIFNSFGQHSILSFRYSADAKLPQPQDFVFIAPENISIIDNDSLQHE